MGSMSMGHWLVVLAVIVLLFGAKKIPELAKGVGKGIKSFKAEMEEPIQKVENKEENASVNKAEETTKA
ncbi:Sec-independent protein translocase protein TatA [Campylobacter majalis]|uniref:Sec-independent protein translocase protein TatA n=1 Tax=Campylobacter majalis TaxID=2790656 RepID=A0ABM8Q9S3_9BACT|nr:twin-arginine translocase TatA/TatE family subunit [Campylobacter majalis]CAD7289618.1 Sec-independent protein translocase protein TatA [Campylobacter majalis]